MNDAAADVPPISNLWNYTQMGFDLVIFSGGKGIRGPQNAGLLLGKKELIQAATMNNSPNSDTVGRGMKVAKEQIVGMVAAVDWFLAQTDESLEAEFRKQAERVAAELKSVPTVECTIAKPNTAANAVPHLIIRYDQQKIKIAPRAVAAELRRGTPSIELNPSTGSRRSRRAAFGRELHRGWGLDAAGRRGSDCRAAAARGVCRGHGGISEPLTVRNRAAFSSRRGAARGSSIGGCLCPRARRTARGRAKARSRGGHRKVPGGGPSTT